jgi:hypothetical protein
MKEPVEIPPEETGPAAITGSLLDLGHSASLRSAKRRGARLFRFGLAATVGAILYFTYKANVADPVHIYLGQAIFALAVLPGLMWAKRAHFGLPLFEVFMITGVNTYAIPLLNGHEALRLYDADTITKAALAVLIYQATANLVYLTVRARPKRGRFWRVEIVSRDISRILGYGMFLTTAYTYAVQFTTWIPDAISPEVRAVCYGTGIIATFVQARRWGEGSLPHRDRFIFVLQLMAQVIFSWVALFLVGGVSILLLALLGYVSGSRKVPLIPLAIALPIVAILFNGKAAMRERYWEEKTPLPALSGVPAFFVEWFQDGLAFQHQADKAEASRGVLDRTSLIHIICLVASQSPDPLPYLMGETYAQIPEQFIPRFFWPGKPLGHVSTYTLCVYYGLQRQEDTLQTTIGFGMVAEAYANYGFVGMVLLGLFMGAFFRKVSGWSAESPIFSYAGLFTVVLMAWTFQTELPLSAWLASLWQACVAVLGLPFVLKNVFK